MNESVLTINRWCHVDAYVHNTDYGHGSMRGLVSKDRPGEYGTVLT